MRLNLQVLTAVLLGLSPGTLWASDSTLPGGAYQAADLYHAEASSSAAAADPVGGETLRPIAQQSSFDPSESFDEAISNEGEAELVSFNRQIGAGGYSGGGGGGGTASPWAFNFTQTVDYGTNLALPLSLTPANTLVSPLSNPSQIGILNSINQLIPSDPLIGVFQDDFQFQTLAGAKRTWQINEISSFSAGYGYYSNLHPRLNELDLLSNTGAANYSRRLSDRTVGALDYSYAYYLLDGQSFVSQSSVIPSLLMRYNQRWDLKGTVSYANASFRQTNFLNSDNYATTSEAIRYVDSQRLNAINIGTGYGYSNAQDNAYSYRVTSFFIGGRKRFGSDQRNEARITASYYYYYFQGTDPIQVGVRRHDNIFSINPILTRYVNDNMQVFASYLYYNADSNITRQLYAQNIGSLGVTFTR